MSIVCTGSFGIDTTRTPFRTAERIMGGSAAYFSYAASFFSPVSIVSAVGDDYPEQYWQTMVRQGIDMTGVQRKKGEKTLFFDSTFSYDFYSRTANKTELNVFEKFDASVPKKLRKTPFLYLGTLAPQLQLKVLEQCKETKFVLMDTIEFFIQNNKPELMKVMSKVDGIVINDIELRMLQGTHNIIKAAYSLMKKGPKLILLKKGEHGAIAFTKEGIYPLPGFPLEDVQDPTGAGDSFGGGFFGHFARKNASLDEKTIKEAMAYGNVMGSFAVEDFSLNRLVNLTKPEIEERYKQYKEMIHF